MRRLLSVLILCGLVIGMTVAQEDDFQDELDLFGSTEDVSHIVTQNADSGTITALENGQYEISLVGVPETTSVFEVDLPAIITYNTADLASDWAGAVAAAETDEATIAALAELNISNNLLSLILRDAAYDLETMTMTYTVDIVFYLPEITEAELDLEAIEAEAEKSDLPESFDAAILTISATETFWSNLRESAVTRLDDVRATFASCDDAQKQLDDLLTNNGSRSDIFAARAYIRQRCT